MGKTFFKKFGVFSTLLILACTLSLSSCSDDDEETPAIVELTTDQTETDFQLEVTNEKVITITKGNGGYAIDELTEDSKKAVEVSAIKDDKFTIKAIAAGKAAVTLKDQEGKSVTFNVTVTNYKEILTTNKWGNGALEPVAKTDSEVADKAIVDEIVNNPLALFLSYADFTANEDNTFILGLEGGSLALGDFRIEGNNLVLDIADGLLIKPEFGGYLQKGELAISLDKLYSDNLFEVPMDQTAEFQKEGKMKGLSEKEGVAAEDVDKIANAKVESVIVNIQLSKVTEETPTEE